MSVTTLTSQDVKFEPNWRPSLSELSPFFNVKLKEAETTKLIQELSDAFNTRNDLLRSYGESVKHVCAYSHLFLPTNLPKLDFLLEQMGEEWKERFSGESWQFIDFGCGPGTYSLSWLKNFPQSKVLLIDSASEMKKQAQKLIEGLFGAELLISSLSSDSPKALFFGNVINEINEKVALREVQKFNPQVVMLIEPGTKKSFQQIIKFRKSMQEAGYQILYPCLGQATCPIVDEKLAVDKDWCHQVLRMSHDPSIERVSQLARLDRKSLPMIAHFYVKNAYATAIASSEKDQQSLSARLMQYLQETKFAFEYRLCLEENGANKIYKCLIPKKKISKEHKKLLKKASIGTLIHFTVIKQKSDELHIQLI